MNKPTNQFTPAQIEWLEALESNKYTQGTNYLKTAEGSFCCLGVACDLHDPSGWVGDAINGYHWAHNTRIDRSENLSDEIWRKLNLVSREGDTKFLADQDTNMIALIFLNDSKKFLFPDIAAHLRKYPAEYFTNFSENPKETS